MVIYEPRGRAREYGKYAINIYTGCIHGCLYCYAKKWQAREVKPRPGILEMIRKDCKAFHDETIFLCFTCDPLQEIKENITEEVISIIKKSGNHVNILTKGKYNVKQIINLLDKDDLFGVTLTFLNQEKSKKFEPNACLPQERIENLRLAKESGVKTWVSIEPVIEVKESIAVIKESMDFVDEYKIGKLNHYFSNINWGDFLRDVRKIMEENNKRYYLKEDLKKYDKRAEFYRKIKK